MSAKQVIVANKARKQSLKLPDNVRRRLKQALIQIKENPIIGPRLHGELKNFYKYRIGDYRSVYTLDPKEKIVMIVKVEHRQGVYK